MPFSRIVRDAWGNVRSNLFPSQYIGDLTNISLVIFFWTTALGIIPDSVVYVYAGIQLLSIQEIGDILSMCLLLAFLLLEFLALIPMIAKKIFRREKKKYSIT